MAGAVALAAGHPSFVPGNSQREFTYVSCLLAQLVSATKYPFMRWRR